MRKSTSTELVFWGVACYTTPSCLISNTEKKGGYTASEGHLVVANSE